MVTATQVAEYFLLLAEEADDHLDQLKLQNAGDAGPDGRPAGAQLARSPATRTRGRNQRADLPAAGHPSRARPDTGRVDPHCDDLRSRLNLATAQMRSAWDW